MSPYLSYIIIVIIYISYPISLNMKKKKINSEEERRKILKELNGQIDTTGNANSNFVVAITMTGKNTLNIH